jgi:hypothetical protein
MPRRGRSLNFSLALCQFSQPLRFSLRFLLTYSLALRDFPHPLAVLSRDCIPAKSICRDDPSRRKLSRFSLFASQKSNRHRENGSKKIRVFLFAHTIERTGGNVREKERDKQEVMMGKDKKRKEIVVYCYYYFLIDT